MRSSNLLCFDDYMWNGLYLIMDFLNSIFSYMSTYTITYYLRSNLMDFTIDFIESHFTISTHNYKKLNVYIPINRMTYYDGH